MECSACVMVFFVSKQRMAYERRISDWSSNVCSSDLADRFDQRRHDLDIDLAEDGEAARVDRLWIDSGSRARRGGEILNLPLDAVVVLLEEIDAGLAFQARQSAGQAKSVPVGVALGGRRSINTKRKVIHSTHLH